MKLCSIAVSDLINLFVSFSFEVFVPTKKKLVNQFVYYVKKQLMGFLCLKWSEEMILRRGITFSTKHFVKTRFLFH